MRYTELNEMAGYDLQARYDHFNELLFGGKLPRVPLRFGILKGSGGVFKYKTLLTDPRYLKQPKPVRDRHTIYVEGTGSIVISKTYQKSHEAMDQILVHEMIHAQLIINEGNLLDNHGSAFMGWVKRCSEKLGWQVPLKDAVEGLEMSEDLPLKTYIVLIRDDGDPPVGYAILFPGAFKDNLKNDLLARFARYSRDNTVTAYEIRSRAWTEKGMKVRAQRPKNGYKIGYWKLIDNSLYDDLKANGKVVFRAGGMF